MKNSKGKKIKSIVAGAALLTVVAGAGIAGIFAYLTATDIKTNKFTIGEVKIQILEPNWSTIDSNSNGTADAAEMLAPGQTLDKDPQIKNIGVNPAYVYMMVKIPTGTVGGVANTELFDIVGLNTTNWTSVTTLKTASGYGLHLYKYNTSISANTTTEALFTDVTLKNVTPTDMQSNGDIEEDIIVEGYAIQSNNLAEGQDVDANEMINGLKAADPID